MKKQTKDIKKMKNQFIDLLEKSVHQNKELISFLEKNKQLINEDTFDNFLIEIFKSKRFDLFNIFIDIKKKKNIEIGVEPLIFCIKNKLCEKIIKILIKNSNICLKDKNGNTPLIYVLRKKNSERIIKLLINKNTDINQKNLDKDSPLLIALDQKYPDHIIKLLINKKTDINQKNKKKNHHL